MKTLILMLIGIIALPQLSGAQNNQLPDSVFSGKQGTFHVQGVVADKVKGFIYFSFTDRLVKTDLNGKMIGSVTGFIGHLGDLDITEDGKIYGSLEYKHDAIGIGITKNLGITTNQKDGFYIAIFDGARIVHPNMNAEKEDLLRTVFIKEATDDYAAVIKTGDKVIPHRFGCSGIDGVAFAPAIGEKASSKNFLYVAYGIYGDNERSDNDNQVILKYDISDWQKYEKPLSQSNLHQSGPEKPLDKYFVKTGNTRYGIQNLAYDAYSGNLFAAVYKGSKSQYPNYDLFVIDGKKKPTKDVLIANKQQVAIKSLTLLGGWNFKWGATGLCPLGDGTFYISHNAKAKDGEQQTTLFKYKWLGAEKEPFLLVK
ncbi:MAG: hypothetical protein V4687_08800 [Bacteroidota bacterium]